MGGVGYVHAHHEWDGNICHVSGGNIRTSAVGGMIVLAGYHVGVGYPVPVPHVYSEDVCTCAP